MPPANVAFVVVWWVLPPPPKILSTSSLTRHINKTFVTALTPAFYSTPELMMDYTTRYPMFLEVDSFHLSPFVHALKVDYPGAFRHARAKQKKLAAQLAGHTNGAKATFKEMLALVALMGDDMRRTLKPSRPRKTDQPGDDPSEGIGEEFYLSENGAVAIESLAALSNFREESNSAKAPTSKEAAQRFLNLLTPGQPT